MAAGWVLGGQANLTYTLGGLAGVPRRLGSGELPPHPHPVFSTPLHVVPPVLVTPYVVPQGSQTGLGLGANCSSRLCCSHRTCLDSRKGAGPQPATPAQLLFL